MIGLRTAVPRPALREFVRVFAQREVHQFESGADVVFEPVPARLEQTLEFQFGIPFNVIQEVGYIGPTPRQAIVGAYVGGGAEIELRPGVISFAVFFRPTGLSRLFGIPMRELSHCAFDAASVTRLAIPLRDQLAVCATFENRVRTMEGVLLGMASRVPPKEMMARVAEL